MIKPSLKGTERVIKVFSNPKIIGRKLEPNYLDLLTKELYDFIAFDAQYSIFTLTKPEDEIFDIRKNELLYLERNIIIKICQIYLKDQVVLSENNSILLDILSDVIVNLMISLIKSYNNKPTYVTIIRKSIIEYYNIIFNFAESLHD